MLTASALAVLTFLAVDDGFGGAPTAPAPTAPNAADDGECVIQGDDGVWRSCNEALELKSAKKSTSTSGTDDDELRDMSPEAQALRERMKALDFASKSASSSSEAPVDAPLPKTKLETEYEKARLDVTQPLFALRIEVARAEARVKQLEDKGVGGKEREAAEAKLTEAKAVRDDVEQIALARMDTCLTRAGKRPMVKNYRMTAGGPIMLTLPEMLRQLPATDPGGCERVTLVDAALVEKVRRRREVVHILETTSFGYHEVAQRKALEAELAQLNKELPKGTPLIRR